MVSLSSCVTCTTLVSVVSIRKMRVLVCKLIYHEFETQVLEVETI